GGRGDSPPQERSGGDAPEGDRGEQKQPGNGGRNVRHTSSRRCAGRCQRRIFAYQSMAGGVATLELGSPAPCSGVLFSSRRRKGALNRSKRNDSRRLCIDRGGSFAQFVDCMSSFPDWAVVKKRWALVNASTLA